MYFPGVDMAASLSTVLEVKYFGRPVDLSLTGYHFLTQLVTSRHRLFFRRFSPRFEWCHFLRRNLGWIGVPVGLLPPRYSCIFTAVLMAILQAPFSKFQIHSYQLFQSVQRLWNQINSVLYHLLNPHSIWQCLLLLPINPSPSPPAPGGDPNSQHPLARHRWDRGRPGKLGCHRWRLVK